MEKSKDNTQYSELLYNLMITIGIILLMCLGSYAIYSFIYPQTPTTSTSKQETQNNQTIQEIQNTSSEIQTEISSQPISSQSDSDSESDSTYKVSPVAEQINSYPIGDTINNAIAVVQECVQSAPVQTTKQIYTKLDEITLPSSISASTGGYIGRDFVCFRGKMGDASYVSKNNGCMACQVDKSGKNNNYGKTQTNVISTCVYTDDPKNTDPSIWTKQMCEASCGKIQDVN